MFIVIVNIVIIIFVTIISTVSADMAIIVFDVSKFYILAYCISGSRDYGCITLKVNNIKVYQI